MKTRRGGWGGAKLFRTPGHRSVKMVPAGRQEARLNTRRAEAILLEKKGRWNNISMKPKEYGH